MIVINMYGAPGSGKTTIATGVFSKLKSMRLPVGLVTEYSRELSYDHSLALNDMPYILGCQWHRMQQNKQDEICITDCPLPQLAIFYPSSLPESKALAFALNSQFDNVNFLLKRKYPLYHPKGHSTEEAEKQMLFIEQKIIESLKKHNIEYEEIISNIDAVDAVVTKILLQYKEKS